MSRLGDFSSRLQAIKTIGCLQDTFQEDMTAPVKLIINEQIELLNDSHSEIRSAVASLIGHLHENGDNSITALICRLADPEESVR